MRSHSDDQSMSPARRAAILIAALDRDSADMMLEQMDPDQADQVRAAIIGMNRISPDEQQQVMAQFLAENQPASMSAEQVEIDSTLAARFAEDLQAASETVVGSSGNQAEHARLRESAANLAAEAGNPELATGAVATAATNDESLAVPLQRRSRTTARRFEIANQAEVELVADSLARESVQTIALVLSNIERSRAAQVLQRFPQATQVEVLLRIADLADLDPEVLSDVEQTVEASVAERVAARERQLAGVSAIQEILAGSTDKHELTRQLRQASPELGQEMDALSRQYWPANSSQRVTTTTKSAVNEQTSAVRQRLVQRLESMRASQAAQAVPATDSPAQASAANSAAVNSVAAKSATVSSPWLKGTQANSQRGTLVNGELGSLHEEAEVPPSTHHHRTESGSESAEEQQRYLVDIDLTFPELVTLSSQALARVFQEVEAWIALVALAGADVVLLGRIARALPAAEARALKGQVEKLNGVDRERVASAQQQVVAVTKQLIANQVIEYQPHHRVSLSV